MPAYKYLFIGDGIGLIMKPAGAFSLLHAARWKSMARKHTGIKPAARISSLTERHPNLLTPRRRRLLMRLCREQIHLWSVCRSSLSLPSCPDSTEVSNSKGSWCKKRPDPLYPQTKPPKPSKSSEALHWPHCQNIDTAQTNKSCDPASSLL